jgi:hypothetical protein
MNLAKVISLTGRSRQETFRLSTAGRTRGSVRSRFDANPIDTKFTHIVCRRTSSLRRDGFGQAACWSFSYF